MNKSTIGVMCWRFDATKKSVDEPDASYWQTDIALIALLELWLGLIVACIPTLAPLLKTYIKPLITKIKSSGASRSKEPAGKTALKDLSNRSDQAIALRRHAAGGSLSTTGDVSSDLTFTTECNATTPRDLEDYHPRPYAIHVQHDIESRR